MAILKTSNDHDILSDKLLTAINTQQPIKEKIFLSNGYAINIFIQDYGQPLVFTFDNRHISEHQEGTSFEERLGWGYDYIINKGWNICAFLESDFKRWYRHPSFIQLINDFRRSGLFNNFTGHKVSYGSSMGGYAAAAFASALFADKTILFNPFSTLNLELVPGESRESYAWSNNWSSDYHDAIPGCQNLDNYIIYDPTFRPDHEQSKRFTSLCNNTTVIRVPGVGHGIPGHLAKINVLDKVVSSIVENHYSEEKSEIFDTLRSRRNYHGYHRFLLASHPLMTLHRKQVVLRHCLRLLHQKYPEARHSALFLRDASDLYAFFDKNMALILLKRAAVINPSCPKIQKRLTTLLDSKC